MTMHSGSIGIEEMRKVLRSWFALNAKEWGLSIKGEDTEGGFIFYSAEAKAAWGHFIAGYMAGRADALNAADAEHARLDSANKARTAEMLSKHYPPPSPAPDAWWYDFTREKMMVFDAETGGWREAG